MILELGPRKITEKNSVWAVERTRKVKKFQKVSEMKGMTPLSILSTHMPKSEHNYRIYSPKHRKNRDFGGPRKGPRNEGFLVVKNPNHRNTLKIFFFSTKNRKK